MRSDSNWSMQRGTQGNSTLSLDRRLERAVNYVHDRWFPVNAQLLDTIRQNFETGSYELNPEALIDDISSDFSLYLYCIRELSETLKSAGADMSSHPNPVDLLQRAGLDQLRAILDVPESHISKHSLTAGDLPENRRIYEAMISAATAQMIAPCMDVRPEVGYSSALLRQLGYALIAWNYPSAYREALAGLDAKSSLDVELTQRLGFSPALLSIKLLQRWGIPLSVCDELFGKNAAETAEDEITTEEQVFGLMSGTIAHLCAIGEALARANFPDTYPTARADFSEAEREISQRLGPKGIERIREALHENLESYLTLVPEIFSPGLTLDPLMRITDSSRDEISAANPYIPLCSETVRAKLSLLYLTRQPKKINPADVRRLLFEVAPDAHILGGLVFTIDPDLMLLLPQTKFGSPQLLAFEPIDYAGAAGDKRLVSHAYRGLEPLVEYQMAPNGVFVNRIAGSFGIVHRFGVLYVEIDGGSFDANQTRSLNEFRAIRIALSDCLGGR